MLNDLHLRSVGPAPCFDVEFAERLNLFTGDNGLGKSFLLDIAWWALTGTWADEPARPQRGLGVKPEIEYDVVGKAGRRREPVTSRYDFRSQSWPRPRGRPAMPGLVIYVRVDGGFSVWDPARNYWKSLPSQGIESPQRPAAYHFGARALWNGLESEDGRPLCNGLVRDWVSWQNQPEQGPSSPFVLLESVLAHLSPHPDEWMRPGRPTRVSIQDVRDIPTIDLPYGNVPVLLASAGMKRILGLSYLLVWAWYEHTQASALLNQPPSDRMILLMDELEAHLHPQWQRMILPAMLTVARSLTKQVKTQVLATTHSPMVMASVEPGFDEQQDRAFLLILEGTNVKLMEYPWAKQGIGSLPGLPWNASICATTNE